jgi:hypothetical protein
MSIDYFQASFRHKKSRHFKSYLKCRTKLGLSIKNQLFNCDCVHDADMGMEIRRHNQIQDIHIRIHSKDHNRVILRTGVQRNSEWVRNDVRHNHIRHNRNHTAQHTDQQTAQPDMAAESAHHTVYAAPVHKPEVAAHTADKDCTDWRHTACKHDEQTDGMDTDGTPEHNPLVSPQQQLSSPLPVLPEH